MKQYIYLVERDCELGGAHATLPSAFTEIESKGLVIPHGDRIKAIDYFAANDIECCAEIGDLTSYYIYKLELKGL